MAKKPAPKKPTMPAAKPAAKTAAKKRASKKAPAKAAKKPPANVGRPVATGKGATPADIGVDLVNSFNAGNHNDVGPKWWAKDIVSIEGVGMAWNGRKAVDAKNAEWDRENEMVGASAEGPFVGATGFAVKFHVDVRNRDTGQVSPMHEIGVYTIKNGKIAVEEFMYGA